MIMLLLKTLIKFDYVSTEHLPFSDYISYQGKCGEVTDTDRRISYL